MNEGEINALIIWNEYEYEYDGIQHIQITEE